MVLEIITITKDNHEGLVKTVNSTKELRENFDVEQVIIDSSKKEIQEKNKEFLNLQKRIKYYFQEPAGISAAFNYGITLSSKQWLWFLNGGDIVHPDLNLKAFNYIVNNCNADVIVFQVEYMQSGRVLEHPELWSLWPPILSWVPHPSTIIRKEMFEKFGFFDESLKIVMDYEFWIRCFSKKVIVNILSIPIAKFDETGLSKTSQKDIKAEVNRVLKRYVWLLKKRWFWQLRMLFKAFVINSKFYRTKN